MEDVNFLIKHSSFQTEGQSLVTLRTTEAHQETAGDQIKEMQALHTLRPLSATLPLNHCYETPHQVFLGWDTQFSGTSLLWPPLPSKAIKLFFSNSPETLSLRFNLASVQSLSFYHQ